MKKALCILLLCTLSTLSILSTNVAFANNSVTVSKEILLVNQDKYSGTDGYEKTFTCSPKNGNKLNIYVKNYSSQPMNFIVNGVSKTVEGNGQLTRTWSSSSGVTGDFEVEVTNSYGYKVDILVHARQFDK